MDTGRQSVDWPQIAACFAQRQHGTEHCDSNGTKDVEREVNTQVDARPSDGEAKQCQSDASPSQSSL